MLVNPRDDLGVADAPEVPTWRMPRPGLTDRYGGPLTTQDPHVFPAPRA